MTSEREDALVKEINRLRGALQEIMAYTDPVEDRAYVIAEGALETNMIIVSTKAT